MYFFKKQKILDLWTVDDHLDVYSKTYYVFVRID